jgi:hypothetical protein
MNFERLAHPNELGFLRTQNQLYHGDFLKSIYGDYKQPNINLEDKNQVISSLDGFVDKINSGKNTTLFEPFIKDGSPIAASSLILHTVPNTASYTVPKQYTRFFVDGNYGFVLGLLKDSDPLWLAITSFASLPGTTPAPVILQIQAASNLSYPREESYVQAQRALKTLRWEQALIAACAHWAKQEEFPLVALQSGSENPYASSYQRKLPLERAKMRYDVSAERFGFRNTSDSYFTLPTVQLEDLL